MVLTAGPDPENPVLLPDRYVTGVPPRDLTEEDIARLDDEQFDVAVGSGLYVDSTKPLKTPVEDQGVEATMEDQGTGTGRALRGEASLVTRESGSPVDG